MAVDAGDATWGRMIDYVGLNGLRADSLCVVALALHEAIYHRGITLAQLEAGVPEAYAGVNDALANTSFIGLQEVFSERDGASCKLYFVPPASR